MLTKLIIVNKDDQVLGYKNKDECHAVNGILHRAYSIYIFNSKQELLIQQRSKDKNLWPFYWSNSCCSHPTISLSTSGSESLLKQAQQRLSEEFGFTTKLKFLYKFNYKAQYKKIGSETELCYVLLGKYNGVVKPNHKEIADFKWVNIDWLKKDIKQSSAKYTPWFKLEIKEISKRNAGRNKFIA